MKSDRLTNRLVESLLECKTTLAMIQSRLEGEGATPWPLIDRAQGALIEFFAAHNQEKNLPVAEEIHEQSRGR